MSGESVGYSMKTSWAWRAMPAVALLLIGCGPAAPGDSTIRFWSPAVQANGVVSPRVSCGAGTLWLPLKWGALPDGTEELIVYIGRFKYGSVGAAEEVKVPFGALVARIGPRTRGIAANTFPPGVEPVSFGPTSCPRVRKGQNILMALFALDHAAAFPLESFDSDFATALTEEALGIGRFAGSSDAETPLTEEALAVGHFTATYGPR